MREKLQNRLDSHKRQSMMLELYRQNQQKKLGLAQERKSKFETVDSRVILYRFLGHLEIHDGHVWKLSTSCWICDKWQYTCLITNPLTAHSNFRQSNSFDSHYIHKKISDWNKPSKLHELSNTETPIITGSFCKWKCQKMIKIEKFYDCLLKNRLPNERIYVKEEGNDLMTKISKILNTEIYTMFRNQKCFASERKPTIMSKIMEKKSEEKRNKEKSAEIMMKFLLRQKFAKNPVYSIDMMNPTSKKHCKMLKCIKKTRFFNILFKTGAKQNAIIYRSRRYGGIFTNEIEKLMKRDSPHFVIPMKDIVQDHQGLLEGYKQKNLTNQELSQYFVYATFMPPGDTKIIINYDGIENKESHNLLESIIPVRKRDLVLHKKMIKKKLVVRQFQKHLSVFKDWMPDTQYSLRLSLDNDLKYSKLRRFITSRSEFNEIYSILLDNLPRLKEIFTYCIGVSSYPYISWLEFYRLCEQLHIPDRGTCSKATIDNTFITTNFEQVELEDNPDKSLCRYEFYEILIRLSYAKYIKSNTDRTLSEAFGRMLSDNVFKYSDFAIEGQQWREDYLWTVQLDDLYQANLEHIRRIFKLIKHEKFPYCTLSSLTDFCHKLDLSLSKRKIDLSFSLCKMTVVNEMEESAKLEQLLFPEFLEFIARLGQQVFEKNETMKLYDKVFKILQKMFLIIEEEAIDPYREGSNGIEEEEETDEEEYSA
ncbi:unnamed protein product [Moneuplotes crassus]|uniref:Uncharacterized protein n=1 Tax=Euplotes crassus TaxID=5936 RepID=A0AAD1U031_EUPCR|nr:unnamed protein product [Moneuplotes crassus]